MSTVVTVTFNPCIDKSISVAKLMPEKKLYGDAMRLEPGGGGINVARGLKRLGVDVVALFPCGGYYGQLLMQLLQKENVSSLPVLIKNNIRESWMVSETFSKRQYRFLMAGPELSQNEWNECLAKLETVKDPEFIIVSGSMPPDFPPDIFERINAIASVKNAKLIVDASPNILKLAIRHGVYMIKPNLNELASLIVAFDLTSRSVEAAAKEIIAKGLTEIVVVSMGAEGALMVDAHSTLEVKPYDIKKAGSVGAGDSMLAGIVYGLINHKSMKKALEFGAACGAACAMNEGTALFYKKDVEALLSQKEFSGS